MDAVAAITNDHRLLEELFEQLRTDRENRAALLAEMAARLLAHQRAEEKHLLPAVRANRALIERVRAAAEEMRVTRERFTERLQESAADFAGLLGELVGALRRHIERVEAEVLPALTASLSTRKREELGRRFDGQRLRELKRAGFDDTLTKEDLYIRAQQAGIPGRSSMSKVELARALLVASLSRR